MSKLLIYPDIHGRRFWKESSENIDKYDKVIFLGDYLDPYNFENISFQDALDNFLDVIDFKKNNPEKVILLLGNHDMPYFSKVYKDFSFYHSRYNSTYAPVATGLFEKYRDLFQIAYTQDDILFTHAGCSVKWTAYILGEKGEDGKNLPDLETFTGILNDFIKSTEGLKKLFKIGYERGGRDRFASCIWADNQETIWDQELLMDPSCYVWPIQNVKQIFGHTLQAFYNLDGNISISKDPIEIGNIKMLDIEKPFELDTGTFTVTKL